jgi:DNA-binding transcriptional ArsR family regulator
MHALSTKPEPSKESAGEPLRVAFDDPAFDDVLAAIGSETARSILLSVRAEPLTASEIADRVDTSVQNTSYHLGKLADAGLVRVCDNVYSEKGCEMKCYHAVETELRLETKHQ